MKLWNQTSHSSTIIKDQLNKKWRKSINFLDTNFNSFWYLNIFQHFLLTLQKHKTLIEEGNLLLSTFINTYIYIYIVCIATYIFSCAFQKPEMWTGLNYSFHANIYNMVLKMQHKRLTSSVRLGFSLIIPWISTIFFVVISVKLQNPSSLHLKRNLQQ